MLSANLIRVAKCNAAITYRYCVMFAVLRAVLTKGLTRGLTRGQSVNQVVRQRATVSNCS